VLTFAGFFRPSGVHWMSRKFYTIFILPHAHARFRKMHVSRNFVIAVTLLAAAIGGVAAWAPSLFFKARGLAEHAASVEAENRKLRDDKVRYETALAQIGDQRPDGPAGVAERPRFGLDLGDILGDMADRGDQVVNIAEGGLQEVNTKKGGK